MSLHSQKTHSLRAKTTTNQMITDCMSTILRIGSLSDIVDAEHVVIERLQTANPTVHEVYFWNIEFTPGIIKALQQLIFCDTRHFTIKILSCRGPLGDVVSSLVQTTESHDEKVFGALETLVLNGPFLDKPTVEALKGQISLKRLRLLGIRSKYHDTIDLGRCIELDLTHSRLFMVPLDSCLISESLARSQHLEVLKLDFCNLSDKELCRILQVCPKETIRELHLSHNNFGQASMNILIHRLLEDPTSKLSILNLHHQTAIRRHLPRPQPNNSMNNPRISWKPLFEALKHPACSSTLQELDVSGNPLITVEISTLAEALTINTTLQFCSLQDCQLSIESTTILANKMPLWGVNLKTLDLGASHFLKASAQRSLLKEGLELNYYIQSVGNLYYYPYTSELEYYLDCNRSGRRLLKQSQRTRQLMHSSSTTSSGTKRTRRGEGKSSHSRNSSNSNSNTTPAVLVPSGLWPHVLARINRELPVLYSSPQGGDNNIKSPTRLGRRESTIYYFLRHSPVLLER